MAYHAGTTGFQDWEAFHKITGGTWGKNTGHGARHEFEVKVAGQDHPVTRGMKDFRILDELWHNIDVLHSPRERLVLFRAFASKEQGGTGKDEDLVVCTKYGKGRGFYNALGHDAQATDADGFRLLMLRGTEWAATGKVTIGLPTGDRPPVLLQPE